MIFCRQNIAFEYFYHTTIAGVLDDTGDGAQRDRVVKEVVKELHHVPIAGFGDQHQTQHQLADEGFGDRKIKQNGGIRFIGEGGVHGRFGVALLRIHRIATDAVLLGRFGNPHTRERIQRDGFLRLRL